MIASRTALPWGVVVAVKNGPTRSGELPVDQDTRSLLSSQPRLIDHDRTLLSAGAAHGQNGSLTAREANGQKRGRIRTD